MMHSYFSTAIKLQGLPQASTDSNEIQTILSIVIGIVAALSLLMIVISGFRYILSSGDSKKIAEAKNGIIYALVGLFVAMFAELIVTFVIGNI